MSHKTQTALAVVPLALVFLLLTLTRPAQAADMEKVMHSFRNNGRDGLAPMAGLTFDAAGNLYGTTIAVAPSAVVSRLS